MLDLAAKYQTELKKLFMSTAFDEKYMFYNGYSYYEDYVSANNTFSIHEFVSLDSKGNILGYIKYNIDRGDGYSCRNLKIINFSENMAVFGIDVMTAIKDIFEKFNFNKLSYCVIVGNPIEKTYDKLTAKYGGRIVGIKEDECKLMDGKLYDLKMYEILRKNIKNNRMINN